jgi:hypothetical protein
MRLFATSLVCGLVLMSGCPTTPAPTKADSGAKDAKGSAPAPVDVSKLELRAARVDEGEIDEPVAEAKPGDVATPAWFDATLVPGAAILQPLNQAKIGPNTASSMLLELPVGTTAQDCITKVRDAMLASLPEVADAVPGDKERMTLQGKAPDYSYTIVCGPGKNGQTTLYLSYVEG